MLVVVIHGGHNRHEENREEDGCPIDPSRFPVFPHINDQIQHGSKEQDSEDQVVEWLLEELPESLSFWRFEHIGPKMVFSGVELLWILRNSCGQTGLEPMNQLINSSQSLKALPDLSSFDVLKNFTKPTRKALTEGST